MDILIHSSDNMNAEKEDKVHERNDLGKHPKEHSQNINQFQLCVEKQKEFPKIREAPSPARGIATLKKNNPFWSS